ncbi:MAG TPA: o-succinylbenzoate synthase [Chloroflexota bacterium]|jgi:O-succinylbenzoate synthase|nr:o-succinylbenzoate synthase [Chloroflexota bacterium]
MRIESLEVRLVEMNLVTPFTTSFGTQLARPCLIVRLRGEGVEGWGECVAGDGPWYSYETIETAWHVLLDFIAPALVGQDVADAEDLWQRVKRIRGHRMAIAAVEEAHWDLRARAAGVPLARMLNATRAEVPAGVSVGIQESPTRLVEVVRRFLDAGYQRIKLKIEPGRDLPFVAAVRERFPDILLSVDANSAYTLADTEHLRALDAFNLLMIEQPLGEEDIVDHATLQRQLKTAICLDEAIRTPDDARHAIALGSCRIINIKPGRVGGILRSIQIHDLCRDADVPVWCGGMLETNVGRGANVSLAALPNFRLPSDISASARYYAEDIAGPSFELSPRGTMIVRDTPGIGVNVDPQALERFTRRRAVRDAQHA